MTGQPPPREDEPDAGAGSPPGLPRWVKISAIVAGVLIVLFVILQVAGVGGDHGPGRHLSGQAAYPGLSHGQPLPLGRA